MFKKVTYTMAIFCMICSSLISSLNAECPCKRRKTADVTSEQPVFVEIENNKVEEAVN